MPQAPLKTKPTAAKAGKPKVVRNAGVMRKGLRSFAPKAKNAHRENSLKKLSAQLASGTEKRLAARAGHLELLVGGKRDAKRDAMKEAAAKEAAGVKK